MKELCIAVMRENYFDIEHGEIEVEEYTEQLIIGSAFGETTLCNGDTGVLFWEETAFDRVGVYCYCFFARTKNGILTGEIEELCYDTDNFDEVNYLEPDWRRWSEFKVRIKLG